MAAYGGMVFYLSSLPQPGMAGRLPDYFSHPIEYLGLTVLLIRALNGGFHRPVGGGIYLAAVSLAVAYAVSDEIHQSMVPHRRASVKDVLSDTLGAVAAMGVAELIQRSRRRPVERRRPAEVILYTRAECHLCHEARAILERAAGEIPIRWREIDVDTDPGLAGRYGGQVPVIVAGGVKLSKLRPDEAAIRRRLARIVGEGDGVARPMAFG